MDKEPIILIGGGGHCRSVIEVIESGGKFEIIGIVDKKERIGDSISGYKIIATDNDIPQLTKKFKNFVITVGQIKSSAIRRDIYDLLKGNMAVLPVIIAATAYVSNNCIIGEGTVVLHKSFVNAGASIGHNCIINSSAIIEHDSKIGDNCHISTGAIINGDCVIEHNCFIGSNAVISNGVTVGNNSIVGAGTTLVKNIGTKQVFVGSKGKFLC